MAHSPDILYESRADAAWLRFVQHRFDNNTASLDELDLELSSLRKHEVLAKQRRNARTCTGRLPQEILGEVFLYVQSIWAPEREDDKAVESSSGDQSFIHQYKSGWMSIVHVCFAWRMTALSLPALWQDIHVLDVHPEYSYDVLIRSARRPLRLTFEANRSFEKEDAHFALAICIWLSAPIFRRAEALKFDALDLSPAILQALTQTAPDMHTLEIHVGLAQVLLPNTLNCDKSCKLRELTLEGCSLPPKSRLLAPTLVNLTLEFEGISSELNHNLTTADVLQAVSSMSSLESFFLRDVPRPARTDDPKTCLCTVELPVTFKNLFAEVNVEEYTPALVDPMEHLIVPRSAHIEIYILADIEKDRDVGFEEDLDDPTEVLSLCRRLLKAITSQHVLRTLPLELQFTDEDLELCYLKPVDTSAIESEHSSRHLNINIYPDTMYALMSSLPLERVVSLDLGRLLFPLSSMQPTNSTGVNAWIERFSRAQNVQRLEVDLFESEDLWDALGTSESNLFPLLETIILVGRSARPPPGEADRMSLELRISPFILGLVDVIEFRREACTPIREVKIAENMADWNVWDTVRSLVKVTTS